MPIWSIASVTDAPEVSLSQWNIFETDDGARHFVGADVRDFIGRVSSEVVIFDRLTLRGKTRSGRVYQLIGPSGTSTDAEYVWNYWRQMNGVASYADVTKRLLAGADDDTHV